MKHLRVREILLLSHVLKAARRIEFHGQTTVICGPNNAGKSCIIKSIYGALGAYPRQQSSQWASFDVRSILKFTVGTTAYSVLHDQSMHTFFDHSGRVLGCFPSSSAELSQFVCELVGFNMPVVGDQGFESVAPPHVVFSPFYIDQDTGWDGAWNSFRKKPSVRYRQKDLLEYFLGITSNEYYKSRNEYLAAQRGLKKDQYEAADLNRLILRSTKRLREGEFTLDIAQFKEETEALVERANRLRLKQDSFRDQVVAISSEKAALLVQRDASIEAANELRKDYQYAVSKLNNVIYCPTCGAEHENIFRHRFEMAIDDQSLRSRIELINEQLVALEEKLHAVQIGLGETSSELTEVNSLLAQSKDAVTLKDVVASEGRRDLRDSLRDDLQSVNKRIATSRILIAELFAAFKKLNPRARRKSIKRIYFQKLRTVAGLLSAEDIPAEMFRSLDAEVTGTGSAKPRAVLTYRWAILDVMYGRTTSAYSTIIVDAPNQKDQDTKRLKAMLNILLKNLEEGRQLILSVVKCPRVKGVKVVRLKSERSLLEKKQYDEMKADFAEATDKKINFLTTSESPKE